MRVELETGGALRGAAWLGPDGTGALSVSVELAAHCAFEVGRRMTPCRVPDDDELAADPALPTEIVSGPIGSRPQSLLVTFSGHAYGSPSEDWVATLTLARGAQPLLCEDVAHAGGSAAAPASLERLPVRFEGAISAEQAGLSALHGDEIVILERLHPRWACLPLRLPAHAPAVRLATNAGAARPLELAWRALHLDGDRERCWLVFHGSARVEDATHPDSLVLHASVDTPHAEWAPREHRVRAPAPACGPSIHEVIEL